MKLGYCYKSKEDNMYRLTIDEALLRAFMDKLQDMIGGSRVNDIRSIHDLSEVWVELDDLINDEGI